jgi:DNA-binding transcriptional regulator YdaS (Cro superfamily)
VTPSEQDLSEHFAHCIQVFGGTTAASRRLGIDERALRRFTNGERPISARLLQDTALALRTLIAEAAAAEATIVAAVGEEPPIQPR